MNRWRNIGFGFGFVNLLLMSFFGEVMPVWTQFVSAGGFMLWLMMIPIWGNVHVEGEVCRRLEGHE